MPCITAIADKKKIVIFCVSVVLCQLHSSGDVPKTLAQLLSCEFFETYKNIVLQNASVGCFCCAPDLSLLFKLNGFFILTLFFSIMRNGRYEELVNSYM